MRIAVFFVMVLSCALISPARVSNFPIDETTKLENDVFFLVNVNRNKARKHQLGFDSQLANIARNYSKQMAEEGFFAHSDKRGKMVADRAKKGGVSGWKSIGENLFYVRGIRNPAEFIVAEWIKSSAHRRNIMSNKWTQMGIGVYRKTADEFYVTQVFIEK